MLRPYTSVSSHISLEQHELFPPLPLLGEGSGVRVLERTPSQAQFLEITFSRARARVAR